MARRGSMRGDGDEGNASLNLTRRRHGDNVTKVLETEGDKAYLILLHVQTRSSCFCVLCFFQKNKIKRSFHDSSPSCIFISSGDRRDENGDSNCTGSLCGQSGETQARLQRS